MAKAPIASAPNAKAPTACAPVAIAGKARGRAISDFIAWRGRIERGGSGVCKFGGIGTTQMPGSTLFLEPMTRIGGKRYSGLPSTNSPVNTPTYGAASKGELLGLVPSSAAQPVSPKTTAAAATHLAAISDLSEWLMRLS